MEASAVYVAEAMRTLRKYEAEYRRLNTMRGKEGTRFLIRQNATRIRDASIEAQVALICYEFVRLAPRHLHSDYQLTLINLAHAKVEKGWTAEDLSERVKIPEATIICLEDGYPVAPLNAARLAHALGVELSTLVLGEGESAQAYWRFAH